MHILAWIYLSVFLGLLFHHIPFGLMTSDKAVFADAIPLSIIAMESYGEIQLYPISFLKKNMYA